MLNKLLGISVAVVLAALIYWVNFTDPLPDEPNYGGAPEPAAERLRFDPDQAAPRLRLPDESPAHDDIAAEMDDPSADGEDEPFAGAPNIPEPTPEEVDALTRWYEERGRLSPYSEYRTYSPDVLRTLAAQGDIYALQLVARHAMRGNDREQARAYLAEAAARGSTHAIERLARDHFVMMLRARRSEDLEQARVHAIETLAWYETAYQRGDLNARTRIDGLRRDFESIDLPDDAWEEAEALAQDHYNDLAQQRTQLGYPVFDDNPHPVLQKYYELYQQRDQN
ncbi:hypothetical protein [Marinimicrobium alkaliphilum]|uniref:hypothetical protein n=1 Tax=Marinimicrobium alkaliphilum TaxID=2202654 RepID=UPI000DB96EAC|nr:hypothetical protein [Marinimicrobium alkaliphilum]